MSVNKLVLLSALLCSVQWSISQHTISGHVLDENNEPIPFALVSLAVASSDTIITFVTKLEGEFQKDSLKNGIYQMEVKAQGFDWKELKFELKNDTIIKLQLNDEPERMPEIEIREYIVPLIDRGPPYYAKPIVKKDCDLDTVQREGLLQPKEVMGYLKRNLRYSKYSLDQEEQGRIYAYVTFDKKGNVTDVVIRKSVSECLDNSVKSAFYTLPKVVMRPNSASYNYQNDGFEAETYLFPITFSLE